MDRLLLVIKLFFSEKCMVIYEVHVFINLKKRRKLPVPISLLHAKHNLKVCRFLKGKKVILI